MLIFCAMKKNTFSFCIIVLIKIPEYKCWD
jgi:hypothetical protein